MFRFSKTIFNCNFRLPEMQAGAVGEVRAVMSDPDLAISTSTGRSRYCTHHRHIFLILFCLNYDG